MIDIRTQGSIVQYRKIIQNTKMEGTTGAAAKVTHLHSLALHWDDTYKFTQFT